jgi:hypothetical protein
MKPYVRSLVVAAGIVGLAAIPFANARTGGMSSGGFSRSGGGFGGGFRGGRGFGDRRHFDHDRFFFSFGWPVYCGPYWYPYYYPPYYYYDYGYYYPPAYDPYYYYYPPTTYYQSPTYSYSSGAPGYGVSDGRNYLTLGHDAGKALKFRTVSRDWLVEYLRAYVINASPSARDDFRRGFISGYGEDGESFLKKAIEEAQQQIPPPPRADTPPSPESGSSSKSPDAK